MMILTIHLRFAPVGQPCDVGGIQLFLWRNMSKYNDYKVLRNKVRKFTALSIIFICIKKLHEISKKPVFEETAYLPWELLYLIKIGFLEGGKNGEKVAVINDVKPFGIAVAVYKNPSTLLRAPETVSGLFQLSSSRSPVLNCR